MPDIERITKEYEKLKANGVSHLLPLDKVILIESKKEKLISDISLYNLQLSSDNNLKSNTVHENTFLETCALYFGNENFSNYSETITEKIWIFSYDFAIVTLKFQNNVLSRKKIDIFWDL